MNKKILIWSFFTLLIINQALAISPDISINISTELPETLNLNENYRLDLIIKNTGNETIEDIRGFVDSIFTIINIEDNSISIDSLDSGDIEKLSYDFHLIKQAEGVEINAKINSYKIGEALVTYGAKNFKVESETITLGKIEKKITDDEDLAKSVVKTKKIPTWVIVAIIMLVILVIVFILNFLIFRKKIRYRI